MSRPDGLTLGGSPLCSYAYLGMSVFVNTTYNAAAGNMTGVPINPGLSTSQYALAWDAWNRLVKVQSGSSTVVTYAYDGLARRITKTTPAETDNFYYSKDWQVLEVFSTGSVATTQFLWGLRSVDDLIARNQIYSSASHWLYSLSDQWNVVAITNASAAVQERYGYNAFGTTLFMSAAFVAESGSSYNWETTFCSYRLDNESGFYQVRYRYLHPTLGRWLSRDPIVDIAAANLFAYCENSPTCKIDIYGLMWKKSVTDTIFVDRMASPAVVLPCGEIWISPIYIDADLHNTLQIEDQAAYDSLIAASANGISGAHINEMNQDNFLGAGFVAQYFPYQLLGCNCCDHYWWEQRFAGSNKWDYGTPAPYTEDFAGFLAQELLLNDDNQSFILQLFCGGSGGKKQLLHTINWSRDIQMDTPQSTATVTLQIDW